MNFYLRSIGLILIYVGAAKTGLEFGTVSNSVTIFWPSGGIALAALLLGGIRYLPAVFIGAYITGVMIHAPMIFGFLAAVGNALETYIGYSLLKRHGKFDLAFNQLNDLVAVVVLGGIIAAIASALLGSLGLLASGLIQIDTLPKIMWRWWRADVLSIAFFTPLILLFAVKFPTRFNISNIYEIAALWVFSIIVGQIIFLGWTPFNIHHQQLSPAWLFPVLFWSGLRAGRRNTALIQLMFLSQALSSAYLDVGFFGDDFVRYGLSNFWMFAMLLAILGMALAIMTTMQRLSANKIAQNAKVFELSHDGILITDAGNKIITINPAFTDITGYSPADVIGKDPRILSSGRQDRAFFASLWQSLNDSGCWNGEVWNRRKDGAAYLERLSIHTITDSRNQVVSRVGIFTDITEQKASLDAVLHQAQYDYLTNIPNRFLFCDRFNQQLAYATRHGSKFAVIYLDLDEFKPVNDLYGHQVGDLLLIAVAERLKKLLRENDTIARFGGDEFAILVSEVETVEDVMTLADKILAALNNPFTIEPHTVNVTGSLGIALYPDHGNSKEAILKSADDAMYQAKQAGNNRYIIATST